MKCSGAHDGSSHVKDNTSKGRLTVVQRGALRRASLGAPMETGRQLVRNSIHFSPDKHVTSHPLAIRQAQRLVYRQRRNLSTLHAQGERLDDTNGSMTRLGARLDLQALIARHNDPANDYHLDLHKVVCIGSQWSDGVSFMELTTMHLLLNIGRAMQSGWELQVQADGSFEFCASKLGVIIFGVNSLRHIFRPVSWALVPSESSEAFEYCYNGIRAAFFSVIKPGALRLCPAGAAPCAFCDQLRDIQQAPEVVHALSDPKERLPVMRAGADNTTKWSKFAKKVLTRAKVIVCYAHATGNTKLHILFHIEMSMTPLFCRNCLAEEIVPRTVR